MCAMNLNGGSGADKKEQIEGASERETKDDTICYNKRNAVRGKFIALIKLHRSAPCRREARRKIHQNFLLFRLLLCHFQFGFAASCETVTAFHSSGFK
jgi:hypothetical protein